MGVVGWYGLVPSWGQMDLFPLAGFGGLANPWDSGHSGSGRQKLVTGLGITQIWFRGERVRGCAGAD